MPLLHYLDHYPTVSDDAFIAPDAYVIGRVTLGPQSSVWFGSTLRGDVEPITLGRGVNIQEHSVIHTDSGMPAVLGDYVSLGHHAIVHGAVLEDHVLIAMSATVLSGAKIGSGSIVAANALVPEGRQIPPRSLVVGTPGKVLREVTDDEYERIVRTARHYMQLAQEYRQTAERHGANG
jgi:carbonic anhydrase/acetyltransferase-like protein (isoleucine patch superfamily)